MIGTPIFHALAALAGTAKSRRLDEHKQFLLFYRELVETFPTDACVSFGNMGGIEVKTKDGVKKYGLELNATDFMWWKNEIENQGVTFVKGPAAVQSSMLYRLGKSAETERLEPSERKRLLELLEKAATE